MKRILLALAVLLCAAPAMGSAWGKTRLSPGDVISYSWSNALDDSSTNHLDANRCGTLLASYENDIGGSDTAAASTLYTCPANDSAVGDCEAAATFTSDQRAIKITGHPKFMFVDTTAATGSATATARVTLQCLGELGGSSGAGFAGVEDGIATETTLNATYTLPSFRKLPKNLQAFYFSNDAGGDYPLGDDANPCTEFRPCLTVQKMNTIALAARLPHIILDARDPFWDLGNVTHTGGYAFTGTISFDATAETIVIDAGTSWTANTIGFTSLAGSRIEVSGATDAANNRTWTIASVSGDTITVNEDITATRAADAGVTVQQYWDQISFQNGCATDAINGEVCAAISGSDFASRDPAGFTCGNLSTSDPVEKINSVTNNNGFIQFNPLNDASQRQGWGAVQNIHFENCPRNNDDGVSSSQDLIRTDGNMHALLLNLDCTNVRGNNNQCFTTHGVSGSLILNMGGSLAADQTDDAQMIFWTAGGDNVLISNREMQMLVDGTSTTPTEENALIVVDANSTQLPTRTLILGPTLSAPGTGSGVSERGIQILGSDENALDTYVGFTTFLDFNETVNCSLAGSGDDCSAAIGTNRTPDGGVPTNYNIYTYRNSASGNASYLTGDGLNATDTFLWRCRGDLIENTTQTSGGDAYILNLGFAYNAGASFDIDAQQCIIDEDDGTGSFVLNIPGGGGQTVYNTRAAALAGQAAGFTAWFTDGGVAPPFGSQTIDSSGAGFNGNQFCSRASVIPCSSDRSRYDLEAQAACSFHSSVGNSNRPECIEAVTLGVTWPMPPRTIPISEVVWGEEIREWRLGDPSAVPVNAGAR